MQNNYIATPFLMATAGLTPTSATIIPENRTVTQVFRHQSRLWRGTLSHTEYCRKIHNSYSFARCEARSSGIMLTDLVCCARAHLIWSFLAQKRAEPPKPEIDKPINHKNFSERTVDSLLNSRHQSASFPKDDVLEPQVGWKPTVSLDEDTLGAINSLVDAIKGFTDHPPKVDVEHSIPMFEAPLEKIKRAFSHCGEHGTSVSIALLMAALAVYLIRKKGLDAAETTTACLVGFFSLKCGTALAAEYINPILNSIFSAHRAEQSKEEDEVLEAQFGISTLASAIVGLIYVESGCRSYDKGCVTGILKTIGDMPRIEDGLVKLLDFILILAQRTINMIGGLFGMDPVVLKQSLFPELDKIASELETLVAEFRGGAPYNYDNAMRVFELEKRATKLVAAIPNSRDYAEYKRSAMSLVASIRPFVSKMERNNIVGNGPRREPLGIMIGGPTGVGKSTCMVPTLLAVNAQVLPDEKLDAFVNNHNDFIWNFIPENPFHDSYHGQFNTIVDEAGSSRDVAGSPDAGAQGILRMINTANFPLHMAHLEDKGSCNFNSEIVWATTNRTYFDFKSMYLPEAYARRFKLSFLHVPKREYCTDKTCDSENLWDRRLDPMKLPPGFDMGINEYYPYDYRPGSAGVVGPPINHEELVNLIVATYKKGVMSSDTLLDFHQQEKLKYIAKRGCAKVSEVFLDAKESFEPQSGPIFCGKYNFEKVDALKEGYPTLGRPFKDGILFSPSEVEVLCEIHCVSEELLREYLSEINLEPSPDFADTVRSTGCGLSAWMADRIEPAVQTWRSRAKNFLVDNKKLVAVASVLSFISAVWFFAKPLLFEQSGSVRPVARKAGKRPRVVNKLGKSTIISGRSDIAQSGVSQNCFDVARKVAKRNVYRADCEGRPLGFFVFLQGRTAILPEHFCFSIEDWIDKGEIEDNPTLNFHRVGAIGTGYSIKYHDIVFTVNDGQNNDQTFAIFPRVVMNHVDITKYMTDDGDPLLESKFSAALLRPDDDHSFALVATTAHPVGQKTYAGYTSDCCYQYAIATRKGECGSPLFALHHTGKPILVGIHVAGSGGSSGIASRTYRKDVMEVLDHYPSEVVVPLNEEPDLELQMGDKFLVANEVTKLRVAQNNQVIPSPLHEAWGASDYAPSALKPRIVDGVRTDPWDKARSKYSNYGPVSNLHILDCVAQETISSMVYCSEKDMPWAPRVFSFRDAVQGVDGVPFCDGIPRNTSSGYPFCLDAKKKGKQDWFGSDGPYDFDTPRAKDLSGRIECVVNMLGDGVRVNFLFADFLKDERRTKIKVESCSTRLISASPMDFLILCKMYFGDLVRWLMSNRIRNGMAMGVNPYSDEWETLAKHMESVGDKMIFGDFSGFDGSLSITIMYKFLDLAETYYHNADPKDRIIRRVLFEDIINSKHVTKGVDDRHSLVYEWFGSNPSGNAITTPLNSFSNILIIKYGVVLCKIHALGYDTFNAPDDVVFGVISGFTDHIRVIVFGDDNGISVSDDWADDVDQEKLTVAMSEFGFTYTDEAKGGVKHMHRPLSSCSFLKRGFLRTSPFVKRRLAPLDLGVILEMPYWTRASAPTGSVEATVDTALMELAMHGEEIFSKWAPIIRESSNSRLGHAPIGNYRTNLAAALHLENKY